MIFGFFLSFSRFSISVLSIMSYNDLFFTGKTPISQNNYLMTPFFTLFMLSHASDKHYFSKYWGRDGCMGRPPPQILRGPSPQSPLGLRPCIESGRREDQRNG